MASLFPFLIALLLFSQALMGRYYFGEKSRPLTLVLLFWSGLFFLYSITPVQYIALSVELFLFLLSSFIMFFVGYVLAMKSKGVGYSLPSLSNRHIKVITFFGIILICVTIYLKYQMIIQMIGLATDILSMSATIRESTLSGDLASSDLIKVLELFVIPFLFLSVVLIYQDERNLKYSGMFLILMIMIYETMNMSRGEIVYLFLMIITFYFIAIQANLKGSARKEKRKMLIKSIVIIVILFQVLAVVRARGGADAVVRYVESTLTIESWVPKSIKESTFFLTNIQLIHYLSSGIAGLADYTKDGVPVVPQYWGGHSFAGLIKVTSKISEDGFKPREAFNYNYKVISYPSSTNVYTFFREHLDDFGAYGSLILHFFWGWLLGKSYLRYLRCSSYKNLVVPMALTIWYMYGGFIMQTVYFNAIVWPIIVYFMMGLVSKKISFLSQGTSVR